MIYRRGRRVVVVQVARHTGGAAQTKVVVDVAIGAYARRVRVRVRQGKTYRAVIKGCRLPSNGRMARLAVLRESSRDVVWIGGALKIFQVAARASRAG